MSNLGVYIHIPFCLRKCHYCDFLSFGSGSSAMSDERVYLAYTTALLNEIAHTPELNRDSLIIDTIFIGGGTPSVLPPDYIAEILDAVRGKHSPCVPEMTLECNPATVTIETLAAYKRMGINRLSFGLQSANDEELALLGRLHSYDDFRHNYSAARDAGFMNISADIMFSLPGQNIVTWRNTLERVAGLKLEHISAYGLIIEDGTPFAKMHDDGKLLIDDALDRDMYAIAGEILGDHGYERYEISNFAKPGYHSRHNEKYWTRAEYIGLGLGAHSLMNETRWRNTESFKEYITDNEIPESIRCDRTVLTKLDAMAEFMFLGLRLSRGISEAEFYKAFGHELYSIYGNQIKKHIALETLAAERGRVYLTERGVSVSNVVMGEFI